MNLRKLHWAWQSSANFSHWRYTSIGPLVRFVFRLADLFCYVAGRLCFYPACAKQRPMNRDSKCSVFVLRNNDLGDVLLTTPLFEAIKQLLPNSYLCVGVGRWAIPLLENNPFVDEVIAVEAPWHNHFVAKQSIFDAIRFIFVSPAVKQIRQRQFDIGIDVLGSHFGALLLIFGGARIRLGVRGYAGGASANHGNVVFDAEKHVGAMITGFADRLSNIVCGAYEPQDTSTVPKVFLTSAEQGRAEATWTRVKSRRRIRVIIGQGDGETAKYWPMTRYEQLVKKLAADGLSLLFVGGKLDFEAGDRLANAAQQFGGIMSADSLCGKISLRETCALTAAADIVICNASMMMHVAAAMRKRALVLLGPTILDEKSHSAQWCYSTHIQLGQSSMPTDDVAVDLASRTVLELVENSTPAVA